MPCDETPAKTNKRGRNSTTPKPNKRSSPNAPGTSSSRKSTPGGKDSEGGKANKGLRHFSMKVCKKVEEKQHTSYNEVADELVKEVMEARREEEKESGDISVTAKGGKKGKKGSGSVDEKNIRRRVYDALNVLMAMDIISKEKKEIRWKGLPTNSHHDLEKLQKERDNCLAEVQKKRECLQELLVQNVCFRNLVRRNEAGNPNFDDNSAYNLNQPQSPFPTGTQESSMMDENKIPLPFIVVNTSSKAVIQCEMNADRTEVMFDFNMPFEINDDNEILKRLGLNKTTYEDLKNILPPDLLNYCREHRMLDSIIVPPHLAPNFNQVPPNPPPQSINHVPVSHGSLPRPYHLQQDTGPPQAPNVASLEEHLPSPQHPVNYSHARAPYEYQQYMHSTHLEHANHSPSHQSQIQNHQKAPAYGYQSHVSNAETANSGSAYRAHDSQVPFQPPPSYDDYSRKHSNAT